MSYGGKTWGSRAGRAKAAGKRKKKSTPTAKKSKRGSAPRAKKKKPKAGKPVKPTRPKKNKPPKKPKKKKPRTFGYDPETGDKVYYADVDGGDMELEQLLDKKPHTVSRYDPSTGRKVKVPVTSSMATDWPTTKPAKTPAGLLRQAAGLGGGAGVAYLGERAATTIGRKVTRTVQNALTKGAGAGLGVLARAAGVSTGTAGAAIIAAALTGWNLGKAISYAQGNLDLRLDAATRNLVHARNEAAKKLGRPLTPAEVKAMYDQYKQVIVRLKANDPTTYLRPGAE